MPTPPTSSEIPAIDGEHDRPVPQHDADLLLGLEHLVGDVLDLEVADAVVRARRTSRSTSALTSVEVVERRRS